MYGFDDAEDDGVAEAGLEIDDADAWCVLHAMGLGEMGRLPPRLPPPRRRRPCAAHRTDGRSRPRLSALHAAFVRERCAISAAAC